MLNPKYAKIINKILRSPNIFKTKRQNIDWCLTFYFILNLMWIAQRPVKVFASLSTRGKMPTLNSIHFGERPYAWNQIRTTFSGPSVSKMLEVKDPRLWYWTIFTQSLNCIGLKSLFFQKIEHIQIMINNSANEFLTIPLGASMTALPVCWMHVSRLCAVVGWNDWAPFTLLIS